MPSVGPGAVLSEMIASGIVPVVKLDKIFRQTAGSRIATNAKLIRHGNMSLEYGSDFQFYDSASIPKSAEKIVELYLQETAKYGVDNVALLSPYRQKTETGVNALNELLREKINPPAPDKAEVTHGTRKFRCGDKVMQIKNCDEISNGDIGYITKICKAGDETTVTIDFGDGRMAEYDTSQLDMLDLGYASTIHKSQGSEYRSVIINLQCAHYVMLTRPLVYTAITRGKENVIIVGERRALCMAIKKPTQKNAAPVWQNACRPLCNERSTEMATILEQYRKRQNDIREQIAANSLPLDQVLIMQELNYRICVLETFESLCKSAPVTMDTKSMGFHFQLVDAYVRFTLNERKFGPKTDAEGQKKRETALQSFTQVVQDGRKRFSSFNASTQEQYKTCINNYIKTILPVWMQYRNTYINF